jgi:glycosyltransferase involved in cell wall biosynthesis
MRDGDKLKSYEVLAKALGKLLGEGIDNWHLTVIGDGPARQAVEQLFDDGGIGQSAVSFMGLTTPQQTRDILGKSDLFVWPAINEAFGMALLEAQASGLPVLAGDAGGVSGIVSGGVTGWLVPVGDVDAFADRLSRSIKDDAPVLRTIGHAGASKAKQLHTVEAAADLLSATITQVVSNYGNQQDGQSST